MLDIDFLKRAYFPFDKPVPYAIGDATLEIKPIMLEQSEAFLASIGILCIDKNSMSSPEIIQMTYLDFLAKIVYRQDDGFIDKLSTILLFCCDISHWCFGMKDNGQVILVDETHNLIITAKQFDEITKIILYQNIINYDDSYVNPEFKKTMDKLDAVRNMGKELPTLERKMNIITAHTGIVKREQLNMTFREHQGLFSEVCGEVEFETTRPIALFGGQKIEHWIYKDKKGKYDDYIVSMGKYKSSFGGNGSISEVAAGDGSSPVEQLLNNNNF